ncbi:DUF3907 family protein [Thalassobacillus sp. CUG 92003]|uniref:DUF3907 family protein n=1 Tax=Thalassobacillus sp. CUG 92003 TaxID=2736641 RepID=UPI0015E74E9B|nr:DUF3907 family protein [Thalassobacillus sp. CUG 92003]
MRNKTVFEQTEIVHGCMVHIVEQLEQFLNHYNVERLSLGNGGGPTQYEQQVLKSLRRLEVFCDEAKDKLARLLSAPVFRESKAEKCLYGIYHQCISEFFLPKEESWYENSRAAYSSGPSITFHHVPGPSLQELFASLETSFHFLRDVLDYYDMEYERKSSTKEKS